MTRPGPYRPQMPPYPFVPPFDPPDEEPPYIPPDSSGAEGGSTGSTDDEGSSSQPRPDWWPSDWPWPPEPDEDVEILVPPPLPSVAANYLSATK